MGISKLQNSVEVYLRRDLIFRKNVYNRKSILKFCYLELSIQLKNINFIEMMQVFEVLCLMELLSGQKVMCKIVRKKEYGKGMNIVVQNVLRKDKMYNLLGYLSVVLVPLFVKRFGLLKRKMNKKIINLYNIKDKKLFYKLLIKNYMEDLLSIQLKVMKGNKEDILYIINSLKI